MQCPSCGETLRDRNPRGQRAYACDRCGWGEQRLASGGGDAPWDAEAPPPRPPLSKLILVWVVSALVIVGPLLLLIWGVPWLGETRGIGGATTPAEMWAKLHPYYWLGIAMYIGVSAAFSPTYDASNLYWFGIPGLDNPFSREDDWNRSMRLLAFALVPGKLVVLAMKLTWRFVRPAR